MLETANPLLPLLQDPAVREVMVNGPEAVFVERDDGILRTAVRFRDEAHLTEVLARMVAQAGRRVDRAQPIVDARLPDGSRLNAVVPPLAVGGPFLTIRLPARRRLHMDDLVHLGTLPAAVADFLVDCLRHRLTLLISGATSSGKTTTLAALAACLPEERVVVIEECAELPVASPLAITLEARPPSSEGKGEVSLRALVRNALRMRPDRLIIGEVRGGEALDLLQAMLVGHPVLGTLHAGSAQVALSRLETMALMATETLTLRAVRQQVRAALDVVVHQVRLPDGRRVLREVAAMCRGELVPVYRWRS